MDKFEQKILEKLDSKSKLTKKDFDKLCESYRANSEPLSDYELAVIKLGDRFFQIYYTPTDGVSSKYPEEVLFNQKQIAVDAYNNPVYYTWYEPKQEEILNLEE